MGFGFEKYLPVPVSLSDSLSLAVLAMLVPSFTGGEPCTVHTRRTARAASEVSLTISSTVPMQFADSQALLTYLTHPGS